MSPGEWIGTAGVSLLLVAYALNVLKKFSSDSQIYLLMNVAGAILAGISAYLISFWPFVVLEGVWALSTLLILIKSAKR